ncbi:hypothetical protein GGD66_003062 [Bradyrhizobium sp. CIR48]|uniref:hypothetical protein n=1 Tax=Bradyrhizobium sp. CIR48 TaxID=2663840 RepID=UPI001606A006|nr:hypothetical protein [Bradyrhizobium sp. CIR48]MBB4424516.1 hypothetical protein [Bradyrhizobium sp. CIR48]
MDENVVRKKVIDVAASLAQHDLNVWRSVGPGVQVALLDAIGALTTEARIENRDIILAVCRQILSPEIEGTEWNAASVTLRTGMVPVTSQVTEMRERAISVLFELFRSASTDAEQREVVNVLRQANYPGGRAEINSDMLNLTLKNSTTINQFLAEASHSISYELKESIEETSWREYRRAHDISVSPLRAECHASAEELMRTIERLRDIYNEDELFGKFKVLVGFESVFPFQWTDYKERGADDYNAREKYRASEASRYIDSMNADNEADWFALIERVASVESNDLATFPPFTKFLTDLARSKPHAVARLLQRGSAKVNRFLPAILAGLFESDDQSVYLDLVELILKGGDHLGAIARHLRLTRRARPELAIRTLLRAIETKNDVAVAECLMMAMDSHPDGQPEGHRFFRPAIEYLNSREIYWWVQSAWMVGEASKFFASLSKEEIALFIPALVHAPKIEYEAERILIQIAKHYPEVVWDCFARRLEKKESVGQDHYEAVPYEFHGLEQELSKDPKSAIEHGRKLYSSDSKLFRYGGGRLLSIAFPGCPPTFANELTELAKGGTKDDVEFILSVLENYEGEETTHDVLKEIVARFPEEENIRTGVAISFENTGLVTGEFGFANAFREKLRMIRSWENDSRPQVRKFSEGMIGHLELRIADEQRRAEERKALRELEYEESHDSPKSSPK